MKNKFLLVGAGGLGREIAWQMRRMPSFNAAYDLLGFIDDATHPDRVDGLPVLGDIPHLAAYTEPVSAALCVGNACTRKKIADRLSANPLIDFPTLCADGVVYGDTVRFGKGCILCLSTILTVNVQVGDFFIANPACTVGHDTVIGDFVTLYPGVHVSGAVHIGACTEIGTGSQIIQGKRIGSHSVVGAGAVVIRDIPDRCTAVGVPAVPI